MKYTIEGFSQEEAIKLGLQVEHLVLLRWFVDFAHTGKMAMKTIDGYQAYWVRYSAAIEDLPLLKIGKDRIYRKFKELAEAGVLRHFSIKDETGSFSFYAFGENYEILCFGREEGAVKTTDGLYKNNGRYVENKRTGQLNETDGSVKNNRPKDPNTKYPNTKNPNTRSREKENKKEKEIFIPPTQPEAIEYLLSKSEEYPNLRHYSVCEQIAKKYITYFEAENWVKVNNKPIRSWKLDLNKRLEGDWLAPHLFKPKVEVQKKEQWAQMVSNAQDRVIHNIIKEMTQKGKV